MGSGGGSMKVHHQLTRGLLWDDQQPSLSLGCKRLRPLAPKVAGGGATTITTATTTATTLDLKSFIRPEIGTRKPLVSSCIEKKVPPQAETQTGGTRWNPTQEQIGILEMLYKGGMRTPTAQQIEQITTQLGKYGKIEGKNVFYWFQNHKARERQKQKRHLLGLNHSPRTPPSPTAFETSITLSLDTRAREEEMPHNKRMCKRSLEDINIREDDDEEEGDKTLELFPLHPEA